MAKPIPELDLRHLSKRDEIEKEESIIYEAVRDSPKNSINLILGTFAGWVVGLGVAKIGKTAAFGFGGGILLLHLATELGYIHVNWDKVREALGRSQEVIERVIRFVKKNSGGSVGFAGGFFFGVASA